MKKTDVTQPVAMATPFAEGVYSATSTENFEIPAATSTTADDSCVIDDGFLPITSTALDDGGKAPERKNFNGMFYLSTDQRFFLQNGGFITYNPDVATAIGGYPQDAILDFIDSNGNYKKVRSLIDDNTNNFVADETLIDGINWEEALTGANIQLSNVDSTITSIPPTALTNFDGQHTSVDYVFIQSANLTNTQGALTQLGVYDISSVLPVDNYSYEVTLVMQFTAPAATYRLNILVGGNGSQALNGFNIASRSGQCMQWCTASVPVSSARTINVSYATGGGTATLNYMQLLSYRRVGTNE